MNVNESHTTVHETENNSMTPHGINTSTGNIFDRTSTATATVAVTTTTTTVDAAPTTDTTVPVDYYHNLEMSDATFPRNVQGDAAYIFPSIQANVNVLEGEAGEDEMTYPYTNADGADYPQDNEGELHHCTAQESLPHKCENTDATNLENMNSNIIVANDPDLDQLMKMTNDQLMEELKHIETAVKCVFKELVAFKTASAKVSAQWAPLLQAESQEAARLIELQAEVEGTVNMTLSHSK